MTNVKPSTKLSCKLFKIGNVKDIDSVKQEILTRKVSENVHLTVDDKNNGITLVGDAGKYNYIWDSISAPEVLSIPTVDNSGEEVTAKIDFITATSKLEYGRQKKRDSNNQYLAKKDRIREAFVKVVFFELDGAVYSVVCSSQQVNINRVIKLIGINNIKEERPEYKLPEDFFNWIFYQYSECKHLLGNNYYLKGIGGFMGNVTDEQNVIKGVSEQTSELTVTKAFISNGESLKNVTARIRKEHEIDIVFGIDHNCNSVIYVTQSSNLLLFENSSKDNFMLIYLYGILIPKLRALFLSSEIEFVDEQKGLFQKKIGIEVIESIMKYNNIELKELKELENLGNGEIAEIRVS